MKLKHLEDLSGETLTRQVLIEKTNHFIVYHNMLGLCLVKNHPDNKALYRFYDDKGMFNACLSKKNCVKILKKYV